MSAFKADVGDTAGAHVPCIVFGSRLVSDDPENLNTEQGTAIRLGDPTPEQIISVLVGLKLTYLQIIQTLAQMMDMPEQELHNRVNERMDQGRLTGGPPV